MALLSSAHYEREGLLEALSLSVRSDIPDYAGPLEADCDDFETSLAYSLGYGDSSLAVSLQSPVSATGKSEDKDKHLLSGYVSVGNFPFEKFSILRCCWTDRRTYYKDLYALSLVFFLVIGAHEGLVGIQATINAEQGLANLAVENVFLVSTVVIAPAVIWLLGIRNTMLLGCILQVGYIASNYIQQYYTLIPGAIVGGFSLGILWVAANLYKSIKATTLATVVGAKPTVVIGKFGGVFYLFVSISLMIGNLISSTLFFSKDEVNCHEQNSTLINMTSFSVCSCDLESGISEATRIVLISTYVLCDILAIVLLFLTIKDIPRVVTNGTLLRANVIMYLKNSVVSIVRIHFNTKAGLLIPVFMLEGLQAGYYLGTFTTDFIAQCIGVRYVGLGVAVWAFGSAIGSFTAGRTVKYVKRFTLFIISTGLSVFLCLFLIFFHRVESFPLVFLVSFGFGISDGILKTGISCLVSGRFPKLKTAVYSILRMWIGVGFILHFALSIFLHHTVLLWIIVTASSIGLPLYGLVDRSGRLLCF